VPERKYHLAKAKYNLEVSAHLTANTAYTDWAVTALYYSALHLVDAFLDGQEALSKDERHPRKHSANANAGNGGRGRNQLVQALLNPVRKEYRSLEEASRRSRYDMEVLGPDAYDKLLDQYKRLEQCVRMMMIAQGAPAA
jgi:uncharacterized protein (UPF0332 family)